MKLTEGFPAEKSKRLMKACAFMGLEGVVMKRKGSIYRPGFRSPDWVKVPIHHREEFVVCGYLASGPSHLSSTAHCRSLTEDLSGAKDDRL